MDGEKTITDRELCTGCGECVESCPNEARSLMGERLSPEDVFTRVSRDKIFYESSGGGVTLSGGEVVAQPGFSIRILKLCRESNIHTAIETCGFAKWETLKHILAYVDLVLYDLKHMDSELHEQFTGVPNHLILENAKRIVHELHFPMLVRLPVIPGYNDSLENMEHTTSFIKNDLSPDIKVHLLPYHRLGESKYERMENHERLEAMKIEPPSDEKMNSLVSLFESQGLSVTLGG